jgi:hypothetical protein
VEECTVGTGAACGSVFLDQAFIEFLKKKFGRKTKEILNDRRLENLVRHFDQHIKRSYNPLGDSPQTEFELELAGVEDDPEIGIDDEYLVLSK